MKSPLGQLKINVDLTDITLMMNDMNVKTIKKTATLTDLRVNWLLLNQHAWCFFTNPDRTINECVGMECCVRNGLRKAGLLSMNGRFSLGILMAIARDILNN